MDSYFFREVKISSWSEFVDALHKQELTSGFLYRGQSDASWGLVTSLERHLNGIEGVAFENRLLEKFKQLSPHYLTTETKPRNTLEWLALMQHHGAPTRLLDWTYSPYIAAFFALESATDESAIWQIDYILLRHEARARLKIENGNEDYGSSDTLFAKLDLETILYGIDDQIVIPFVTEQFNERQMLQQGLFLFGTDASSSFQSQLTQTVSSLNLKIITKYVLATDVREKGLKELALMNISHKTIFPGLDGIGKYLSLETSLDSDLIHRVMKIDLS